MTVSTLMVQGTASSAGKSVLVTALCRILRQDGYRVAPFKSQNMALNSFVTKEGGEIGRAQAVQAEAAGIDASILMNPILLKPEADAVSQVVLLGKVSGRLAAGEYYQQTLRLFNTVRESLDQLMEYFDVVVIEGAGSPAEINLKEHEIANMRVARLHHTPVVLVGDIDRGGVFASLVGTLELLEPDERALVKGFIINKFRGSIDLLRPGLELLERRTGVPVLGVIPYFRDISIAQEDSVYLDEQRGESQNKAALDIAVIHLPHLSNYDDFDPLESAGCRVRYIRRVEDIGNPDLVIIPGTKTTISDLNYLSQSGLGPVITDLAGRGTPVVGICGGYQMLGKTISDPEGVESSCVTINGLGLLEIETEFRRQKTTSQVKARVTGSTGLLAGLEGLEVDGYEIHMGVSRGNGRHAFHVFQTSQGRFDYADGNVSPSGLIVGTYIHGLFHNTGFTSAFIDRLRRLRKPDAPAPRGFLSRQEQYERLAKLVRDNINIIQLYDIIFRRS